MRELLMKAKCSPVKLWESGCKLLEPDQKLAINLLKTFY